VSNIERVLGGNFNDVMRGSANDDTMSGSGGDDILRGLGGADDLFGDGGSDTFVFEAVSDSTFAAADTIDASNEDVIDLRMIDANVNKSGIQLFVLSNKLGAGKMTLTYDADTDMTYLDGDTNGDKVADFRIKMYGDQTGFTNFATSAASVDVASVAHPGVEIVSLFEPHEAWLA
jgi:Ca2+-binding RTX toxin-like protein